LEDEVVLKRRLNLPRLRYAHLHLRRALLVRETALYLIRQAQTTRCIERYRLRDSGQTIFLRHHTPDLSGLDEIFWAQIYDLPPAVQRRLAALERPLTVLDLGANIGLFGTFIFERLPGIGRLTSVEPDPANLPLLAACKNASDRQSKWEIVEACASTCDGTVGFEGGRFLESRVAQASQTDLVEVRALDIFPYMDSADVVKMDIEGSEWEILCDDRFRSLSIPILALEYHKYLCPYPDPYRASREILTRAGYTVEAVFQKPIGVGMVWAWKDRAC
jgi:FkbM family methyltransferase